MKYLLHIDTSTDIGTVAIGGDGVLLAHRINTEARNHAATINIMIQELLQEIEISLKDISGIVVCGGPGSYTGLRIGLATAKGICYALNIPLFMDNTLKMLSYHAYRNNNIGDDTYISLIVAREKEYFIGIYDKNFNCTLAPQHIIENDLKSIIKNYANIQIITNATENSINNLNINDLTINRSTRIDLDCWAFYSFEQYKCNASVILSAAEPFYLKQVYTHN